MEYGIISMTCSGKLCKMVSSFSSLTTGSILEIPGKLSVNMSRTPSISVGKLKRSGMAGSFRHGRQVTRLQLLLMTTQSLAMAPEIRSIYAFGLPNQVKNFIWISDHAVWLGSSSYQSFNTGDYVNVNLSKQWAEAISSVLHPDDRTNHGKELRLKQHYSFVLASLQDVVRRFKDHHSSIDEFPDKVALQNAHPVLRVPELFRILLDEEGMEWLNVWEVCTKVFSFTNHILIPESLGKWPIELLARLPPQHLQIIYENVYDNERLTRMSIIDEGKEKMSSIRGLQAHPPEGSKNQMYTINSLDTSFSSWCLYYCPANHVWKSNKQIKMHECSCEKDFYELWPHKFQNKTNDVTPLHWLGFGNPGLNEVITKRLGTEAWITNLELLSCLRKHAQNEQLQREWNQVRRQNKARLAIYIEEISGVKVSIDAMFDVQVKRIHEYKRQFLNIMSIIYRYDCIKNMSSEEKRRVVPRICILAGNAAPGYEVAKMIIKLVTVIGERINHDPDIGNLLKVVFVPDYNDSVAEIIIPASDLSQHISTAGNEASETSNMKFAMNGSIILGTHYGANLEIQKQIGKENIFLFGVKVDEVPQLRAERRNFSPPHIYNCVVGMLRSGLFGHLEHFQVLCDTLEQGGDFYLIGNDFQSYLEAQAAVDRAYVDRSKWTHMSIMSTAGMGKFSSDRVVKEYGEQIWGTKPFTCTI